MRMRGKLPIFNRSDCWNLNNTLAPIIATGLEKFRDSDKNSHPHSELTEDMDSWNKIIDKMIWSFRESTKYDGGPDIHDFGFPVKREDTFIEEILSDGGRIHKLKDFDWDSEGYHKAVDEYNQKVQEGLDLFAKYFRNLWD